MLEYTLGGLNIAEVLDLPVSEALAYFSEGEAKTPAAVAILKRLNDVGLGYIRLGQPLTTLSGGERQRLKLAIAMAESGEVYILDEPTSGLHLADVENLLALLDKLVESGKSVIVIEHHQAVMAHADWIIDLGQLPVTTVARWCSKARRPIWCPPGRPSPASIWRSTCGTRHEAERKYEMMRFLISFDDGAMNHISEQDLPAVSEASRKVVQEAKDAGVWIFGAGLYSQQASIVATDGTVTDGPFPETKAVLGGFSIIEVPSREEALDWAAKIAAACRCAQEVREIMFDPES